MMTHIQKSSKRVVTYIRYKMHIDAYTQNETHNDTEVAQGNSNSKFSSNRHMNK